MQNKYRSCPSRICNWAKVTSFVLFLFAFSNNTTAQNPNVREVMDNVLSALEITVPKGSVDTLKSGAWNIEVTGVATTFMATLEVLKQANADGINLILTHEPTYYNHFDSKETYGKNDPIVEAKEAYIRENNLTVFRFHDIPHMAKEDMINTGMVMKLGWEENHLGNMLFDSPFKTVGELTDFLKNKFQSTTIRVVGDPNQPIQKIELLPGAYGNQMQVAAYNNPDADVLIVGEAREWETIEYARDAQELGRDKALIVMGHADSEEGGMEYVAMWLKDMFPALKVKFIPANNPLWSPN